MEPQCTTLPSLGKLSALPVRGFLEYTECWMDQQCLMDIANALVGCIGYDIMANLTWVRSINVTQRGCSVLQDIWRRYTWNIWGDQVKEKYTVLTRYVFIKMGCITNIYDFLHGIFKQVNMWYDFNGHCSPWFDSYSSLSISSLWGRTNSSSSESSCGCSKPCRKCHPSSWSLNRVLVGTQIRLGRPQAMRPLQCSSKRRASAILIFERSFHTKSAGAHALSIQDDGSLANAPHEIIVFWFPVVKPSSV